MIAGVRSTHVRALLAGLTAVGLDAAALARAAGVDPAVLADPEQFVPAGVVVELWRGAARVDASPDLGLRVGAAVPAGAFDVLDYLLPACATLGDAWRAIERLAKLATTISRFRIVPSAPAASPAEVRVESELLVPATFVHPQGRDYVFSAHIHRLRRIDAALRPARLELRGPAMASPERYREILGVPVMFDQVASALVFTREDWARPIPRADATLQAILERHASALAARAPAPGLVEHARATLATMIGEGLADVATLARRLGMSSRTLQRRLEEHGIAYSSLLDDARSDLARAYLTNPELSVEEVAEVLGFSESSAFSRAFRRWTGMSPRAWRNAHAGDG